MPSLIYLYKTAIPVKAYHSRRSKGSEKIFDLLYVILSKNSAMLIIMLFKYLRPVVLRNEESLFVNEILSGSEESQLINEILRLSGSE
jgi:hypothetical protein